MFQNIISESETEEESQLDQAQTSTCTTIPEEQEHYSHLDLQALGDEVGDLPGPDIEIIELPVNGRSTNLVTVNRSNNPLDRLQRKVEDQLGGPITDPVVMGRLILMSYRKVCALSQEIRDMKTHVSTQSRSGGSDGYRQFNQLKIMQTTEEYYSFVSSLKNADFQTTIVSCFH